MRFLISKPLTSCGFVLAISFGLLPNGFSQESKPKLSLADKELQKRRAAVEEAQMLLQKGDELYLAGKFKDAIDAYAGASASFPDSPTTAELRNAALDRYAQASIEHARELARVGKVAEAKKVIEVVLDKNIAPNHPGALATRNELDDPIRTNPAITGDHVKDVDQVRRLLYMADGAYDLGKFDEAENHYTSILKIDSHNEAARRGMERVSNTKSKFYKSAYGQARAEALMQVSREWELPLASKFETPNLPVINDKASPNSNVPLSNKLTRIIIPQFIVENATLMEAVDVLRARAAANDTFELVPELKGMNITVNLGDPSASPAKEILARKFDLRVSNVPVEQILKYITDMTKTSFRYDDHAVTITHKGAAGNSLISRTYRVPPDFLSNLTAGASVKAKEEDDIFNETPNVNKSLAQRMGAQEAFALQGVSFPQGASVTYIPTSNSLLVVNTLSNHDIIQQIIDLVVQTDPVIVTVKMTMIKIEKSVLEELGFDWMINEFGLGGKSSALSDRGYLTGGTVGTGALIDDFPVVGATGVPRNPITAGNRSGEGAFSGFNLDTLLASGGDRDVQQFSRAPGVVGLNGVIDNTTMQVLMRGMDQNKGADILATPSITTRSGQAASITMIREFIYASEYETPQIPQSVNSITPTPIVPSTPSAFETRDTGVFMEVLPTVDENRRYIDVAIKPVITDFDGFVNYGSPINFVGADGESVELTKNAILQPVFSVKKVDSSVVIADGATIVIGGLLKDSVTKLEDKTPILGSIPMLGRFFKSEGVRHNSTAILFFVNVELVDPTGKPYRER
ncbi:MAG: Amuc_1098 family type IV pilus outer membrane protein [Akkermansiaceae bacterium]|jgi:general secretion pathway protein D